MLTCIACSKQLVDADNDAGAHGGGTSKPAVKSLTSQIKDVVLKLSGVYRPPPGRGVGGPSSSSSRFHRSFYYDDDDLLPHGAAGDYYYPYPAAATGHANSGGSTSFRANGAKPTYDHPRPDQRASAPVTGQASDDNLAAAFPEQPKEWVAQVEPGVHITFVSLPEGGGNDLKRIRFSREMFNKWQAQRWWGDNYDRVMELYNVQRFNRQALPTPPRSEDERDLSYSRIGSTRDSPVAPPFAATTNTAVHPFITSSTNQQAASTSRPPTASSTTGPPGRVGAATLGSPAPDPTDHFFPPHHHKPAPEVDAVAAASSSVDAASTSSRDDVASVSVSNASDMLELTEWVEQDQPGVYITIRQMPDGTRDLRRVRFSRERFGEVNAKLWWEDNRDRIHAQYL